MDMWRPFKEIAETYFKNTTIIDKFQLCGILIELENSLKKEYHHIEKNILNEVGHC